MKSKLTAGLFLAARVMRKGLKTLRQNFPLLADRQVDMSTYSGYNVKMAKENNIEVGDLVYVDPSTYTVREHIPLGIVVKKMKTLGFYVVYYGGKYHQNIHYEEMEKRI